MIMWQLHQDVELTFYNPKKLDQEWSLWKGSSQETNFPVEEQAEKAKICFCCIVESLGESGLRCGETFHELPF